MPPKPRFRFICAGVLLAGLWLTSVSFITPLVKASYLQIFVPNVPASERLGVAGPNDFVMFWAAGRMAANGQAADAYTTSKIFPVEQFDTPADSLQLPWTYPPPIFLLTAIVQPLPFFPAFFAWSIGLALAALLCLRGACLPWPVLLAGLLSPAALLNFNLGQIGFFTGAVFLAAVLLAARKPVTIGLMLASLTIKPQSGLLVPVILAARGNWRGLSVFAAGVALLCAVTTLLFGWPVWQAFLQRGLPLAHLLLTAPFPRHWGRCTASYEFYGISVLWMLRSFGCALWFSALGQAVAAAAALLVCWRAWRRPAGNLVALAALTSCLALLVIPYGYLYDLCGCSIGIAALAWQEQRLLLRDVLLWTWPVTGLIISQHLDLELAPVVLALAAHRAFQAISSPTAPIPKR